MNTEIEAAIKCAIAALSQNTTLNADIAQAKKVLTAALSKCAEPTKGNQ